MKTTNVKKGELIAKISHTESLKAITAGDTREFPIEGRIVQNMMNAAWRLKKAGFGSFETRVDNDRNTFIVTRTN